MRRILVVVVEREQDTRSASNEKEFDVDDVRARISEFFCS